MRSQVIKVRNAPQSAGPVHAVRVKPFGVFILMFILGLAGLIFSSSALSSIGFCLMLFALFGLVMLPDRTLITFSPENLILYNRRDHSECFLIYWDEIVNWQYEWHPVNDDLVIMLVDDSIEMIEVYSKRSVAKYLNLYAPNKEIKNVRMKDGRI